VPDWFPRGHVVFRDVAGGEYEGMSSDPASGLYDDGERPWETLAQPIVVRRAAKDVAASVNA
jgi:hypothetical protein